MIKYGLFLVFIGFIINEGVYAHPSSKRNDTSLGSLNKHPKNTARRSMYYEDYKKSGYKSDSTKETSLESIVLAIDTGVKNFMATKNKPDMVDKLTKSLLDLAKKSASNPVHRSKGQEYDIHKLFRDTDDIRPELIRYKDEKPSVLLEINSESIINNLKDLLQSKMVRKLMEQFTKEAAVVYRSIKYDLENGKNKREEKQ